MAVTILARHPETYTKTVLPQSHGIEPRDVHAYPLPPNANKLFVDVVIDELRAQGHHVTASWTHEKLVDWTMTHRKNDRSFCSDEDWRPNPRGPTLLHFTGGGWDCRICVDGIEHRLEAQHLRMSRQMLATILRGRP